MTTGISSRPLSRMLWLSTWGRLRSNTLLQSWCQNRFPLDFLLILLKKTKMNTISKQKEIKEKKIHLCLQTNGNSVISSPWLLRVETNNQYNRRPIKEYITKNREHGQVKHPASTQYWFIWNPKNNQKHGLGYCTCLDKKDFWLPSLGKLQIS